LSREIQPRKRKVGGIKRKGGEEETRDVVCLGSNKKKKQTKGKRWGERILISGEGKEIFLALGRGGRPKHPHS